MKNNKKAIYLIIGVLVFSLITGISIGAFLFNSLY